MNKKTMIVTVITFLFASLFVGSTWGSGRVAQKVVDINQRSGNAYPQRVAQLPDAILFLADDGSSSGDYYNRKRLWRSDGTAAGTYRLDDSGDMIPFFYDEHYKEHEGAIYFPAESEGETQVWRTDGTQAGTYRVQSFGASSDNSIFLRDIGEKLVVEHHDENDDDEHLFSLSGGTKTWFFTGNILGVQPFKNSMLIETYNPPAVYVSDGTAAGTQLIASSSLGSFWTTDSRAYFVVDDTDLYVTDGTAAGTQMISSHARDISFIEPVDDRSGLNDGLHFVWGGDMLGKRFLLRTDGTPAGTHSLMPLTGDQYVDTMFQINGLRYFLINEVLNYGDDQSATLWVTDGTAAGTRQAIEAPNTASTAYYGQVNNSVAILTQYAKLWYTSGTADTQGILMEGRSLTGAGPFAWNNNLYFFAEPVADLSEPMSLGRTNGYEIRESTIPSLYLYEYGTASFYQQDNLLYVIAEPLESSGTGRNWQLWQFELNAGTPRKLADDIKFTYNQDNNGNDVYNNLHVTAYAGSQPIYMFVNSEGEMWRTDGTPAGTYRFSESGREQLTDIPIGFLGQINGRWLFAGDDPAKGVELYATVDGSPATTELVKDINMLSAASNPDALHKVGNRTCYVASDGIHTRNLYCTDGTTTELIDAHPVTDDYHPLFNAGVINNQLYYVIITENGQQLWRTNGTKAGTVYTGVDVPVHFYPTTSATTNNGVHFYALSTVVEAGAKYSRHQYDLWRTDGTPSGTYKIQTLSEGSWFDAPHQLTAVNNQVYFFNKTPNMGMELWKTDGWNTTLVKDIAPGIASSKPDYTAVEMVAVNGQLYFWADDGTHGRELWRSNGTAAGTYLVKDVQPGSDSSWLKNLTAVGNRLFFTPATTVGSGYELWMSYGTANGTYMVKDINAPWGSADPRLLTPYHNNVLFAADDGVNGSELWRSDGTANGTIRLTDFPNTRIITDIATTWDTVYVMLDDGTVWYSGGYGMGATQVMSENGRPFKHNMYMEKTVLPVNNDLYIVGSDGNGNELWRISP